MAKDFMVKESELDDIQIRVLHQTLDKSCVVTGCAGSGKSVIALQKAKRIQNEKGDDYEIIVYTKALCDYMNGGRLQLGLHKSFYYDWQWRYHMGMPKADYVIVDEIQDFTKDEINGFIQSARKNFFFFGDTGQSIYSSLKEQKQGQPTMPVEDIRSIVPLSKEFPLYYNYRLPKPVARITQDYVGVDVDEYGDGQVYRSDEKQLPIIINYNSLEDQVKAIARIIKKDSLTDVGILVSQNIMIPLISSLLNKEHINHEIRYNAKDFHNSQDTLNFTSNNPKLMTYHSAKGLQFETVFIPNFSQAIEDEDRKALYVAMTRTSRDLYVFYTGSLPTPLSNVPKRLYKDSEVEEIEDI